MSATINCIVCFGEATCGGGHVHRENEKIVARFCKTHFKTQPQLEGCKGCYGQWTERMGIDESFCQVMYIDKDGIHPIEQ